MQYCGYNSHTTFSDGKNTPEEMIQAAIRLGMPAIGISDHCDTPCDQSYCMKAAQYPAYLAQLRRLKEQYKDRITVMIGMELDLNSDPAITWELDYFLASVHYLLFGERVYAIDHADGPNGWGQQQACVEREFGGDLHAFQKAYFDAVVENVRRSHPTIVGHFDVITKFSYFDETDPVYQRLALEALEQVVAVCPVVEVNTGAISRGWRDCPYPADFLLRGLREMGGQVILGADTHAADTIDCAFPLAVELIRKAGFDRLLTLWDDGFREQPLSAL